MHQFNFFINKLKNNVFNRFSVLDGISLGSQHSLDPAGRGPAQLLAEVLGDARGPQGLDLLDELGAVADFLVLELVLHVEPQIFNRIKIRTIARPQNGCSDRNALILLEAWQGAPSCRKWVH